MDELKWRYAYLRDKNVPTVETKFTTIVWNEAQGHYVGEVQRPEFMPLPTEKEVKGFSAIYLMLFTILFVIMLGAGFFLTPGNKTELLMFITMLCIFGIPLFALIYFLELKYLDWLGKYAITNYSFIIKYPHKKPREYKFEDIEYFEICEMPYYEKNRYRKYPKRYYSKGIRCVSKGTSKISRSFMHEGFSFYKDPIHKMFILGYKPELVAELKSMGFRIRDISRAKSQHDTENIREL